jgi:ADP-ribose pyrophosphatase YjhB (NUDIX family)
MIKGTFYESAKESAIEALRRIDPRKPAGTKLFNAIAQVSVSVAIEAVCLRKNSKTRAIEIFLTQRLQDDTAYHGEWHCPGSILRPGEKFSDVFTRLAKKEFAGNLTPVTFLENFNNPKEARGHFLSVIYLCTTDASTSGIWYPVNMLPKNTVKHHSNYIIPLAVNHFARKTEKD